MRHSNRTAVAALVMTFLLFSGCSKKAPSSPGPTQSSSQSSPQGTLNSDGTYTPAPNPPGQTQNPAQNTVPNPPSSQNPITPNSTAGTTTDATVPPTAITVPAGNHLVIRTTERLSASHDEVGDRFTGVLAQPLLTHGHAVFPQGTRVTGTVVAAKGRGRFAGSGALGIELNTVGGLRVHTSEYEQEAKGRGQRSAGFIGGGTGLGAIIGGIAGGGKGALIGGIAGAGAGTAGAAYTGKRDVVIPSESLITFKLTEPLTVH